ncbi:MAG: antibiotic biosynthesis monooxygenase [Verrucomicrobia bacterium]|nr:antibiotic biosynthesis monooxygenase [Verrucomicrobiota bacterium]
MFAVIYRGYVKKGQEEAYKQAWNTVASYFIEKRGAIGSSLHRTEDGMWVAYSRWPDKKTRDASWQGTNNPSTALPDAIQKAILTLKEALDDERSLPDICMDVVDDLL